MSATPESEDLSGFPDRPAAATTAAAMSRQSSSVEGRMLQRLLQAVGNPPIEFVLWNGERVARSAAPAAKVRITDRSTLLGMLRDPYVQFGDAYSAGRVEVEGDLVEFMALMYHSSAHADARLSTLRRLSRWLHRPHRNSLAGSRENIHHHYDIGNEFYALWLGETMAYTCAYYAAAGASLEQAQIAKMDHVCRKLQLKPGDSVVEAGCGWGSLALHMASRYGARVRAFNISREQLSFAR